MTDEDKLREGYEHNKENGRYDKFKEQEKEGLPTAARALNNVKPVSGRSIMENPNLSKKLEEGDELLRRQDVEQLIEDKIERITEEIEEIREREDRTPPTHVAIRDELGELLEEVQNQ